MLPPMQRDTRKQALWASDSAQFLFYVRVHIIELPTLDGGTIPQSYWVGVCLRGGEGSKTGVGVGGIQTGCFNEAGTAIHTQSFPVRMSRAVL